MPNIKSAIKRVSVSEKKAAANKSKKSAIRTTVKKAKADIVHRRHWTRLLLRAT